MLATYLTEIESFINERPLIPINDDVNHMEALTPNHRIPQDNVSSFRTKWKFIQNMLSEFWKRWIAKYLPLLTQKKKWIMNI